MNKVLREKLKKIDSGLNVMGYVLEPYGQTIYLSRIKEDVNSAESYIRVYLHKNRVSDNLYQIVFSAEPCRIPGGHDYMSIELATDICRYWNSVLKVLKSFNEMEVVGTPDEISECFEDIWKRKRKQV